MPSQTEQSQKTERSLPHSSRFVKARLAEVGITQKCLAAEAGITETLASNMLAGRRRGRARQVAVWEAFCRLTRSRITLTDFWGELLNHRLSSGRNHDTADTKNCRPVQKAC